MALTPEVNIYQKVLDLTTVRQQLIGNNISNANTPNYKRTDMSFAETLELMAQRAEDVEKNAPPDLMTAEMIAADLSRGTELTFLKGQGSPDMGVEFTKSSLLFDLSWYKQQGLDPSLIGRDKNLSQSDVISNTNPIIFKTKGAERLDGNNVNVDLEVAEMIKNSSYYNMLTSIVSGEFRIYRTIITAR